MRYHLWSIIVRVFILCIVSFSSCGNDIHDNIINIGEPTGNVYQENLASDEDTTTSETQQTDSNAPYSSNSSNSGFEINASGEIIIHQSLGSQVSLQASDIVDQPGEYLWQITFVPEGSSLIMNKMQSDPYEFIPDKLGLYSVELYNDGRFEKQIQLSITPEIKTLDFFIVDAKYNGANDTLVLATTEPSRLKIIDALTLEIVQNISLPKTPTCLSVSVSGKYAAIGHDALVTLVDLQKGVIENTYIVSMEVFDIVMAENGYIYPFPVRDQWEGLTSLEITTGIEHTSHAYSIYAGTRVALHPTGKYIYGADNNISPSDIEKYDISNGQAQYLYDSIYHGDYSICGDLWISEDGIRLFTRCGNVFRSSENEDLDMRYNGKLESISLIKSLADSQSLQIIAACPFSPEDSEKYYLSDQENTSHIIVYDYQYLSLMYKLPLPYFLVSNKSFQAIGEYLFFSVKDVLILIVKAPGESNLLYNYAVSFYPMAK